jgi:hypothetical protein
MGEKFGIQICGLLASGVKLFPIKSNKNLSTAKAGVHVPKLPNIKCCQDEHKAMKMTGADVVCV